MAAPNPKPEPASQRFVVSHPRESDFEEGLRRYAKYRDLGIAAGTDGMVQAHVIRFVPPCRPEEVAKLHFHDVQFQMVYVLKGWITTETGISSVWKPGFEIVTTNSSLRLNCKVQGVVQA